MNSLDNKNKLNEKTFSPSDIWYLETTHRREDKVLHEIDLLIHKGNGYSLYNLKLEEAFNMHSQDFQRLQYLKANTMSKAKSMQLKKLYERQPHGGYYINLNDLNPLIIRNINLMEIFNDCLFYTSSHTDEKTGESFAKYALKKTPELSLQNLLDLQVAYNRLQLEFCGVKSYSDFNRQYTFKKRR